jgi:serpin B
MRQTKLLPGILLLLLVLSGGCKKKVPTQQPQTLSEIQKEPTRPLEHGASPSDATEDGIHVSFEDIPSQTSLRELTSEIQPIVRASNDFALELYAKIRSDKRNLFFSPCSIYTALAMVCSGTRGRTEAEMIEALHWPFTTPPAAGSSSAYVPVREQFASVCGKITKYLVDKMAQIDGCELSVANALWGQKDYEFRKEFIALVQTNYGGYLHEVDFKNAAKAACTTINRWVEFKTNQKIGEIITPNVLDTTTRLVVTNAIYFKCDWDKQFNKERTKKALFTCDKAHKIYVLMMNRTAQYGLMETDEFQALELPYAGNKLSMLVLLPRKFDGLHELEKRLTLGNLLQWLPKLDKCDVAISIPKFKMKCQINMVSALQSMGMKDVFSARDADLSGMTGQRGLSVSRVVHKAFIDINEEGTEAAAATGSVPVVFLLEKEPLVFRADHPFLFLIRDNSSGSILFIGRVMNPR